MISLSVIFLLILSLVLTVPMTGPLAKTLYFQPSAVTAPAIFEPGEEPVLLIDYCRRTVATVGGDGYDETVLWLYPDGSTQVHHYDWYEYYEGEEHHTWYTVDNAVIADAYALIAKYDFAGWKNRTDLLPGMCGGQVILKYLTPEGDIVRVSTDSAPEEGQAQMYDVIRCVTDRAHTGGE
ncbi:MAG: hypothetical protein CW338_04335 [Clostridiales bacterium]|nr:hypothetical protein [Clostridiales bacterium]